MKHPRKAASQVLDLRRQKHEARLATFERRRALGEGGLQNQYVLVKSEKLNPDNPYAWGTPEFITRGYYVPRPFVCKSCGIAQVWTETQQKWWYEVAKGQVYSTAVRCRQCRAKDRQVRGVLRPSAENLP